MESGARAPPAIFHEVPEFKMFMEKMEAAFVLMIEEADATEAEIRGVIQQADEGLQPLCERVPGADPSGLQMTLL